MVTQIYADTTPLLEAIAASDFDAMLEQTLYLLGQRNVPPAKLGGSVGLAALWGGGSGHTVSTLSVAGRIALWMRSIPIGPEPDADARRRLAPALPLLQGFLAVAEQVKRGLPEPHPALPAPLLPAEVQHADGVLGGMREALAQRNLEQVQRILMGYYATGTDYRELLTTLYAALSTRYPWEGHPLIYLLAGVKVMDMAEWGGNGPAFINWYPPLMLDGAPDAPLAEVVRAYIAAPEHDLAWLRKRLAPPKEDAAGLRFQQALLQDDTAGACNAVMEALRAGATPRGVAAGMALAVAKQINGIREGDREALLTAGHALLYVHAVHVAMLQTQTPSTWPLLFTAAGVVNSLRSVGGASAIEAAAAMPSTPLGGLMAPAMLRSLERQLLEGDAAGALASSRRYIYMGNPSEALAGIIAGVAACSDVSPADEASLHVLPIVAAACEEYLSVPSALRQDGLNELLTAALRLAAELRGPQTAADRVRERMNAEAVRG